MEHIIELRGRVVRALALHPEGCGFDFHHDSHHAQLFYDRLRMLNEFSPKNGALSGV
jgi:hypothetical protein